VEPDYQEQVQLVAGTAWSRVDEDYKKTCKSANAGSVLFRSKTTLKISGEPQQALGTYMLIAFAEQFC